MALLIFTQISTKLHILSPVCSIKITTPTYYNSTVSVGKNLNYIAIFLKIVTFADLALQLEKYCSQETF